MKSVLLIAIASGVIIAGPATATDMPDVAKKNNCSACHAIDKKVVGPAWKDVATKYKNDAEAWNGKLAKKIKNGGSGAWGAMPMPANSKVSEADLKELLAFIKGL